MSCKFTVVVQKEDDWYVAKCIENGVASQGRTIEDSIANLREAIELYYEDSEPEIILPVARGTLRGILEQANISLDEFLQK